MNEFVSTRRLTREQFRALARDKGWKFKMLAQRWGVTPEWVSMISRDPDRDIRFDDALYGLPNLRHLARDLRRREIQVAQAVAKLSSINAPKTPRSRSPGYRYHGYLGIGTIVITATQFGTVADEGERGMVFHIRDKGTEEIYGVIFENLSVDWFSPALVDAFLVSTGLIAAGGECYQFVDEASLRTDFASGLFDLRPTAVSKDDGL